MSKKLQLISEKTPQGDQVSSIKEITESLLSKKKHTVLRGATGTGKTFTIANVINNVQKPTLIMAHNKTLAGQLYMEFKELFPNNAVKYFISYFDYYQPEAYIPRSDLYIDKSSKTNLEIEMMRLSTANSLISRKDVIVIASVAAIYGAQDPHEYKEQILIVKKGQKISQMNFFRQLVNKGYKRNNFELEQGCFRPKGDSVEIVPSWSNEYNIKIIFFGDVIEEIFSTDILTGNKIKSLNEITIFPGENYVTTQERNKIAVEKIKKELVDRIKFFKENNKLIEAQRIEERVRHDLEAITEFGVCGGIENYAMYLDNRDFGNTPFTIFDYFPKDYLLVVDESHISLPQIHGMYAGDHSRKTTLVEYGFRLPSALDNRPLKFNEFLDKINQAVYISATPAMLEQKLADNKIIEQINRPTGLIDPEIEIYPTKNQMDKIIEIINNTIKNGDKIFITALTIKMSEDLTSFLQLKGLKVAYLHNKLKTLERIDILNSLRKNHIDIIVGVNLLREGLDVPEVATVIILDADKEGFLRNSTSLIQTIGRAARNINGKVIMFADRVTSSMQVAIDETNRRRNIQISFNKKHNIKPASIIKKIQEMGSPKSADYDINKDLLDKITKKTSRDKIIFKLKKEMQEAAKNMEFEKAADIRDLIIEIQTKK